MILYRYFARRFLFVFSSVLALFFAMIVLLDLVEQLRRFGTFADFGGVFALTLLTVPRSLYQVLPLIIILSTLGLFLSLSRSSELVVSRAAGRSALKSLLSPLIAAMLIGLLAIAILNPLVASTQREYERRVNDLTGEASTLNLASDGLWLRQGNGAQQTVIRARGSNLEGTELTDVTFVTFKNGPIQRIEAKQARLIEGGWEMGQIKLWPLRDTENPEADAQVLKSYFLPSTLTADQIRDSFGAPSSIPIWDLPRFIDQLEAAGFTARRHKMWLHLELAQPVFLLAMVLIGAAFTMRHQRGAQIGQLILSAILLSFGLYFLRNFAAVLGENGQIPVILAAWAPPFVGIGLAMGLLLHHEDG